MENVKHLPANGHVTHNAKYIYMALMELSGAPENQALIRLVCFSSHIADKHYRRTLLPLDAVRAVSGFPEKGDYFIARHHTIARSCEDNHDGKCSTTGFMSVLIMLRAILFQDSVFLRPVFNCEAYV